MIFLLKRQFDHFPSEYRIDLRVSWERYVLPSVCGRRREAQTADIAGIGNNHFMILASTAPRVHVLSRFVVLGRYATCRTSCAGVMMAAIQRDTPKHVLALAKLSLSCNVRLLEEEADIATSPDVSAQNSLHSSAVSRPRLQTTAEAAILADGLSWCS